MSGLSSSRIYLDKLSRQKHTIAAFGFDNHNGNQGSLTNKVGFEILL